MASSYTYENKSKGIVANNGRITIVTKGKPVFIPEASLSKFEAYYRKWQHASWLIRNDSFLEGWTNTPGAKELIQEALNELGVTDAQIESLTFSQLQTLLITDGNGGAGVIFGLHNTYPKPLMSEPTTTWTQSYVKKYLSKLPTLIHFFQQEFTSNDDLVTKSLRKVGLLAASCTIWLLRYILIFLGTLKSKKS